MSLRNQVKSPNPWVAVISAMCVLVPVMVDGYLRIMERMDHHNDRMDQQQELARESEESLIEATEVTRSAVSDDLRDAVDELAAMNAAVSAELDRLERETATLDERVKSRSILDVLPIADVLLPSGQDPGVTVDGGSDVGCGENSSDARCPVRLVVQPKPTIGRTGRLVAPAPVY